jgi:hypothetical protein
MENIEIVTACFRGLLGRSPHETEVARIVGELDDGLSLEAFLEDISRSPEFRYGRACGEFVPPGHFFSAVPSEETRAEFIGRWPQMRRQRVELPGISLSMPTMEAHFQRICAEALDYPFPATVTPPWRYHFDNPAYGYADGISLYSMMRHLRPKRIVEVGSGYSSALMLDTDEREFGQSVALTFIDPFPELLLSFLGPDDHLRTTVYSEMVQNVDLSVFSALEADDILFIDSTHVAKLGSDVNYLYFEVLPRLQPGVCVHVHDIIWPFEYPAVWIKEGRAWNEAYLLRALLQHSDRWEILYFSDFMVLARESWIKNNMPLLARSSGGHIWLKVREH